MATQGPLYPSAATNVSDAGGENKDAWANPTNVFSDNATEASITAATFDSPDISQILVASGFGATIPAGATIDGITVEIDRRSIISGSGADFRVQLATGTAFANLVGSNKAATATVWPATSAVATYGGVADTWTAGLTAAQVNAAGFAVFLSASAKIANADIGADFIRVTIDYTAAAETPKTGSDSGGGADSSVEAVTLARTEAGAGAEANAESAAYLPTEAGAGAEVATVVGVYVIVDSVSGVEASILTQLAEFIVTDAGSGAEISALVQLSALQSADAGVGADTGMLDGAHMRADPGTGADTATETADQLRPEAGAGAELAALFGAYVLTDGATGADAASVEQPIAVVVADAAAGADHAAADAALVLLEVGGGTETSPLTGALAASETGLGIEGAITWATYLAAEVGSGSEDGMQAEGAAAPPAAVVPGRPAVAIHPGALGRGGWRAPPSYAELAGFVLPEEE